MSRTILLVDDDDAIRLVARLSLERLGGHEVVAVAGGQAALEALAATAPDVVLLDVMMPGMDGPTTLQRVREHPAGASVDVVFLTASVRPDEVARLEALGVVGVLGKPFEPTALPGQLAALLGWDEGEPGPTPTSTPGPTPSGADH
ncbi:MAG: response regulator [Nitriliruptoraceae bacterium]|nr:response regulator [Nitriliruptoraceae bacterium]